MFKKSLIAAAVLAAATTAAAADVTVYGKADVGLAFTSVKNGVDSGRTNTLHELNGQTAGSRWGLKGVEDLGNGLKVGFILESGFNVDDGTSAQGGRLFGREAAVYLQSDYGRLMFGRMGSLASGFPDTGLFGGNISPFAVCFGEVPGHRFIFAGNFSPLDNAVTYITPSFAGFKVHLQYSMNRDTKNALTAGERENTHRVDRFWSVGLSYNSASTEWNTVIDQTKYAKQTPNNTHDSLVISTGVRHNFGPAIGYAGAQYFKDARDFTVGEYQGTKWLTDATTNGNKKGFGAYLGVDIPAAGGFIKANVGYMKAKGSEDTSKKLTRWTASAGYWYNLSKRSVLWGGVGYTRDDLDGVKTSSGKSYGAADAISAGCGIVHNF